MGLESLGVVPHVQGAVVKRLWRVAARVTAIHGDNKADSVDVPAFYLDLDATPAEVAGFAAAMLAGLCGRKSALVTASVARVEGDGVVSATTQVQVET